MRPGTRSHQGARVQRVSLSTNHHTPAGGVQPRSAAEAADAGSSGTQRMERSLRESQPNWIEAGAQRLAAILSPNTAPLQASGATDAVSPNAAIFSAVEPDHPLAVEGAPSSDPPPPEDGSASHEAASVDGGIFMGGNHTEHDDAAEYAEDQYAYEQPNVDMLQLQTVLAGFAKTMADMQAQMATLKANQSSAGPSMPMYSLSPKQLNDLASAVRPTDVAVGWMTTERPSDQLDFMRASKNPVLSTSVTEVKVEQVIQLTPKGRTEQKAAVARFDMTQKLMVLSDTITHHVYLDHRRQMVLALGVLANLQANRNDGYDTVMRHVTQGLASFMDSPAARRGEYTRLRKVGLLATEAQRNGKLLAVEDMMDALDNEFAKVTSSEQHSEIRAALEAISVTSQSPSAMLAEARVLYQARYSSLADTQREELVEGDLRAFIMEKIEKGAEVFAWMKPFQAKLTDADFLAKDLKQWSRQFLILERTAEYVDGFTAAATAEPPRSRRARINLVDDEGDEGDEPPSEIAALGEQVAALADMVRQLGATPPGRMGATPRPPDWRTQEWVTQCGVVGFPAPADRSRPDIKIGEIWRRAGVAIPEGCPRDPTSMVGHLCPCNARRCIPESMWFWHPDARQFAADPRRPPASMKSGFGYFHRLGKCSRAYEEGHRLGRANPAANGRLLDPLPAGVTDCIGA